MVLDPFIGTGTTAIAAKQLGRNYIGLELDSDYVKIAKKNVAEAKETKINGSFISIYLGKIRTMQSKDFENILEYKKLEEKRYKILSA